MTLRRLVRSIKRGGRAAGWQRPDLIVVGIGNPGPRYRNTRHNVGWWCVDELAHRAGAAFERRNPHAELAETFLRGMSVAIAKPRTYVNRSGEAVEYLLRRYNASARGLMVVLDDMDLDPGKIRIRKKGSPGGHNGLKSISSTLGTDEYLRVRIGIGRPQLRGDEIDYVLGTFPPDDRTKAEAAAGRAADAVEAILLQGVGRAMNEFN